MASNNNTTTTKFKVDISELKSAMQEAKKQVAYANSEFKSVSSSMDDWSKSSDGLKAKLTQLGSNLKSQETILNEYEKTLEEVKKEYGENSKEALEYATKLNNQQAVVNKIKKEIAGYEDALEEVSKAEKTAAKTGKSVAEVLDDVGNEADDAGDGFTVLKGAVAEFVGNALTNLVSGLKDAVTNLVSFGDEADKAMNSFQASTGATAEEMADFEDVMKNIYKGNYGESFEDIATSMGEVKRIAGDIGADDLEKMTTNALTLRDTFDFEVSESMRAVNSLMDQFGITSDEAFNLIAQGAQNGLNQNGDLLDVINEYSTQFESAGYSADEMFNMLSNGVESGTWSVDKLGDAVKEFNIRMSDGSAKDAVEALGFSWEAVSDSWSAGGDEAKSVFNMLINELDGMEDSVDGYGIGVGLLGTMFEDLGFDAVYALSDIQGEFDKTKDTMGQINEVKYNSVGEAIQGIGRNLQVGILIPISEKILPIVSELANKFSQWLNDPATQRSIKDLTDKFANFVDNGLEKVKTAFTWILDNKDAIIAGLAGIAAGFVAFKVASIIMAVTTAIKGFTTGLTLAQVAMKLFNTVVGANPILKLVSILIAVVAAIATFIATNDEARAKFLEIWGKIVDGAKNAINSIGKFFTETLPAFINKALEFFKQLPSKIWTQLVNVINKVTTWKNQMLTKAREAGLNFINKVIEFVSKLPAKIQTYLTNIIAKITTWISNLKTKAKDAGTSFVNTVVNYISQLPSKIQTYLTNIITKVTTWVTNMKNKAKTAATSFVNTVVTYISQLPAKIQTYLTNIITKITTWITNLKTKAKTAGTSFINTVVTYISQLPTKIQTYLTSVITKLSTWVTNMKTKGKDAIKGLIDNVIDGAKNLPTQMGTIGKNIVDGVWTGIKNAKDKFFENVKGFFSGLVDKAKEALDINSPSKTFADEVGKWIPAGIAVGIDDNAKTALESVKNLALDTVGSARAGLSTATTTLGGKSVAGGGVVNNFTQVINSPKQLSRLDIYRQSKNLLGYAGGGMYV